MSEEIDSNKTIALRECIICHYWYFLEITFSFQLKVCDGCHSLMEKAMSSNDATIASVKGNNYRIHSLYVSKDEAINLLRNAYLTEISETL